ncbi:hypothetical protein DPMN_081492 [Dreissena polymorpha]|uniref:Uncharacterized protein n=1 Tax=Dreissena polymorpha TaxID=45954 RepID=A0A9D3Y518_DREPO|nr:hypothetical protein DPMN_081492 [Dreissena polymorpha]
MEVQHRAGAKHGNADALSREPIVDDCEGYLLGRGLEHLPCGRCDYCQRAERNWGHFVEDVDDVVPLAKSIAKEHEKTREVWDP